MRVYVRVRAYVQVCARTRAGLHFCGCILVVLGYVLLYPKILETNIIDILTLSTCWCACVHVRVYVRVRAYVHVCVRVRAHAYVHFCGCV